MKFKDKYTIFIKNQKPISLLKMSCIIIATIIVLLFIDFYLKNLKKSDYIYSPVMENATFRATFVGDVMMGRYVQEYSKKYDYDSVFKKTSYLWKDSNYISCNLESAIIDDVKNFKENPEKEIKIAAKSDAARAVKKAGFNIVALANNHIADYLADGVKNTVNVLKEEHIDYVGAGENLDEAKKYNIKEINGIKVATLAISNIIPVNYTAKDNRAGILTTTYDEYPLLVKEAKNNADLVIVYAHWGAEYSHTVLKVQEEIAKNLINSGADIIIGAHQHTLQPIEKYNNGIIFYGVGNFVFDQGFNLTKETTLINFSMDENGNYAFELFPLIIERATPQITTNFYHKRSIFNQLTKKLNKSDYRIENNKLIIAGKYNINNREE